jgi:polyisoprenoid-binding protein YceI
MKYVWTLAICCFYGFLLSESHAQELFEVSNEESKMTILGTSTLHDWEADVTEIEGNATILFQKDQVFVEELQIQMPVTSIKSDKKGMDRDMHEALKASRFPEITFELINASNDDNAIDYSGELTVGGVTQSISGVVTTIHENNGILSFSGEVGFRMTDFDIEPPTALFGALKTGDELTIRFTLVMKP